MEAYGGSSGVDRGWKDERREHTQIVEESTGAKVKHVGGIHRYWRSDIKLGYALQEHTQVLASLIRAKKIDARSIHRSLPFIEAEIRDTGGIRAFEP